MDKRDLLKEFREKSDELINSKYILAGGKVGDLLKAIASSEMLYQVFSYVTDGFDYKAYKGICFTSPDGGRGCFKMPAKDEDAMALVFLLLMEIEAKKEDMFILCDKYFYTPEGKQMSYQRFCDQILTPFVEAVERTVDKLLNADLNMEEVFEKEQPKEEKPTESVKDDFKEITELIQRETNSIKQNKRLSEDFKEEAEFVLDRLNAASKKGDREDIASLFIALKYMNKSNKKAKIDLDGIAKVLREKAL